MLGLALQTFEKKRADGAQAIQHILENFCKKRKHGPHLLITFSVRNADFMSMTNNRRQIAFQCKPQSEKFARLGNPQSKVF